MAILPARNAAADAIAWQAVPAAIARGKIVVKKMLQVQNNRRIVRGLRPRGCFFTEPISMIRLPANTNLFALWPRHGADACVLPRGCEGMRYLDT